jgi:hypothetical protein
VNSVSSSKRFGDMVMRKIDEVSSNMKVLQEEGRQMQEMAKRYF